MTAELPRSAPALPQRRYIFQATTRASYFCDGSLIGWTLAFYVLMASVVSLNYVDVIFGGIGSPL